MASPDEFAVVLRYLEAGVGLKAPTGPEQTQVYFDLLGHLPADVLLAAARRALAEHNYPTLPPVGLIARHAAALAAPPVSAGEAWELALALVRRFGPDLFEPIRCHPPERQAERRKAVAEAIATLPPRVAAAARAYGWRALCDVSPSAPQTAFAQFRDAFNALDARESAEAALPPGLRADSAEVRRLTAGIGGMPAIEGRAER